MTAIIAFMKFVYLSPADLLWMAPELLRERQQRPASCGSQKRSEYYLKMVNFQKCDVYSFAIILQEFHTRKGPYSNNSNLSTRGKSSHIFLTEFLFAHWSRAVVNESTDHGADHENDVTCNV